MKKLTIKDIANEFNVSISTVSKALNDSYEISEKTKEKIKKYAKKHKYKPNFNALSLKNRKTKTIGIIIPNMLNYFFAQVFKGIEKTATKNGYKIIICISNESFDRELEIIEMLSNGSVDGFILSISKETELKKEFTHFQNSINENIPIVMFDRVAKDVNCDKVIINNFQGVFNTVKHLCKIGHKNIAFISTISKLDIGKQRYLGYLKGLEEENIAVNPNLIINIFEKDYKKYEALLKPIFKKNKIDSVIATDESSAISAMKIAIKKGYNVPENFSVVAFSNGILARHSSPKLTTISQHGEIVGMTATKMLIERLEKKRNKKNTETKIIETDLVMRESTKFI